MTPAPNPITDGSGNLYFNLIIPGLAGGQHTIEVQVGGDVSRTVFSVIAIPTPPPTVTPTPAPTRVPRVLQHARHSSVHYTVNVPSGWPQGRVTFFARAHSGTPGSWVQTNTVRGATRYEIQPLTGLGLNLVGTYFKERYSSEALCGTRGYIVVRESALLVAFPEVGVALHIDVCEADLPLEAETGFTNEVISSEIIKSLRNQN